MTQRFLYIKRDTNGNKVLTIKSPLGSFSIQTNGNLPRAHKQPPGRVADTSFWVVLDEADGYTYQFGTKRQQSIIESVSEKAQENDPDPRHAKSVPLYPEGRAKREAELNVKEAQAHLDVVGKSLRENPKRKTKKKNPINPGRIAKATRLYERFHDEPSDRHLEVDAPDLRGSMVIGTLDAVEYTAKSARVGARRHNFKRRARPLLCVTADGKTLFSVLGNWHFTDRGIVDL